MKLSTRLAIAMVTLVLLVTAILSAIIYQNFRNLVIPRALERLQTQSQVNALRLQSTVREGLNDLAALCESDALKELVARQLASVSSPQAAVGAAEMRRHFESRFVGQLKVVAAYQSIKIVAVADGGRDLIRVFRDRDDPTRIRIASGDELHRRQNRGYFQKALGVRATDAYISEFRPLRNGAGEIIEGADPIIHVAKPLFTEQGEPFGIAVINIDLNSDLDWMRAGMTHGNDSFLIGAGGNYLFHPNSRFIPGAAGFIQHRVYDDFVGFDEALGGASEGNGIWANTRGQEIAVGWTSVQLAGGPRVVAVEAVEFSKLNMGLHAIQSSTLLVGATAVVAAILLAIGLAASLARPLVAMTRDVRDFTPGRSFHQRETGGSEEIALLGSAFAEMAADIKQKTELLEKTIESIVDPVLVGNPDGGIVLANGAARRLLGVAAGECSVAGKKAFELLGPDGTTPMSFDEGAMARALRGESTDDLSLVVRTDRYLLDVRVSGRPLYDDLGKVAGGVVVYHDVTESNRATAALMESERVAQMIVATALDAFIQVDASGRIVEWSPRAEELLGWTREEAIGVNVRHLIVPSRNQDEHRQRLSQFLLEADSGASGWRYVAPSLRRDGTEILTEVSLTVLRRKQGVIINAFLRDVTRQREAELQLQQAQRLESIGQLTGGIAHDFNNLLTIISGTIEFLADGVRQDPELSTIVRLINDAAIRGARLTSSLLAFGRKQSLQPEEIDVNLLIRDLGGLLEPTLGRNITITTGLAEESCIASADASQLSNALLNLALNARDAMTNGGNLHFSTTHVRIGTDESSLLLKSGEYIAIAVSDTGSGIPADVRSRIFEPFFSTKEPGKGTGLGLSMVYGFVKQSGGHIDVSSAEAEGTVFTIYLPKAMDRDSIPWMPPAEYSGRGNETILCVEDDPAVRMIVVPLLESLGYTVLSAANAAEALVIEQSGRAFDLLFTDIVMPGPMNGFQLATEILSLRPDLKVLFASGFDDGTIVRHGRFAKTGLLLAKPYRRTELARKLREALRGDPRPSEADHPADQVA